MLHTITLDYSTAMNLDSLEAFVVFSETLNFTRAAQRLNISQPALHVKIKKLSQELGVPLYSKKGRTLELSPYGTELARFGRETSTHIEGFLQTLLQGHQTQPVVLAAGAGCYLYLLGEALGNFQKSEHPGLRLLTADATSTVDLLRSGQAHMGVTVLETVPPDLKSELLYQAPGTLVVPREHPLARHKTLPLSKLDGISLIVPPVGKPFRSVVTRTLASGEVSWRVAVEASGWELMLHFVQLGLGAALVNGCCRIPDSLKAIPVQGFPTANYYLLSKRTLALSPHQQLLYDQIRQP